MASQHEDHSTVTLSSQYNGLSVLLKKTISSPKFLSAVGLWILGLSFMFITPSYLELSKEDKENYSEMIQKANNLNGYDEAVHQYLIAEDEVLRSKVWFWRFREPYKHIVPEKMAVLEDRRIMLEDLEKKRIDILSFARRHVGLWSEYGLEDARERFWKAFEAGKLFAQRQTFWQMLMHVFSAREENIVSLIFEWIFTAVLNFTFCLLGSLFYYFFSLGSMIYSYHPDPFSASAFYFLAFLGACSVVATYLIAMYGMVASGVYVVGKMALKDAALQYERRQRLAQQYQRQHQD